MPERTLVIDHLKFSYEGLFNAAELYNIISTFFYEKGYDWYEKSNYEQVTPSGKQMHIIIQPWKNVSDYYKLQVQIKLIMTDIKEVEVEHQGQELKLNQGLVRITFDGYVFSDRKGKWSDKPWKWLFVILTNKYFFREHLEKFETWVRSDIEDLQSKIKVYLNTYKYMRQS